MMRALRRLLLIVLFVAVRVDAAEDPALEKKLAGLDAYMQRVVKDWNVPGVGVAIVVKDRLVYAKGFGYRDYGRKLPFTSRTTQPIASNTAGSVPQGNQRVTLASPPMNRMRSWCRSLWTRSRAIPCRTFASVLTG